MTRSNRLDFATRCVHAGQAPDPTTGAVMMPIYATSTFVQESPGVHKGYDYARTKNPSRSVRTLHRRPRRRQRCLCICVRARRDRGRARMP
jgi:cystathionine beta-lyase/cystathionine gamma-synthase